jgi:zinc finger protein 830
VLIPEHRKFCNFGHVDYVRPHSDRGSDARSSSLNFSHFTAKQHLDTCYNLCVLFAATTRIVTVMSARSLLRQRREEARIDHPLATYSKDGALRCSACAVAVKHWEGHLGSKQHRATVLRLKAEAEKQERARLQEQREQELKRSRAEAEADAEEDEDEDTDPEPEPKKAKTSASSGFPADFFSDPSMAPVPLGGDDEDEEMEEDSQPAPPPQPAQPKSQLDLELEMFQQQIVAPTRVDQSERKLEAYNNATVMAEPVMASETPEGFPPKESDSTPSNTNAASAPAAEDTTVNEEAKRKEKEEMERELIMDRLLAEEQAQEEADNKVLLMKQKLEAAKARRKKA